MQRAESGEWIDRISPYRPVQRAALGSDVLAVAMGRSVYVDAGVAEQDVAAVIRHLYTEHLRIYNVAGCCAPCAGAATWRQDRMMAAGA